MPDVEMQRYRDSSKNIKVEKPKAVSKEEPLTAEELAADEKARKYGMGRTRPKQG